MADLAVELGNLPELLVDRVERGGAQALFSNDGKYLVVTGSNHENLAYAALWLGATVLGMKVVLRRAQPYAIVMLGLMAGWAGHFLWALVETHALGSKAGWLWWWALALTSATTLRARSERA